MNRKHQQRSQHKPSSSAPSPRGVGAGVRAGEIGTTKLRDRKHALSCYIWSPMPLAGPRSSTCKFVGKATRCTSRTTSAWSPQAVVSAPLLPSWAGPRRQQGRKEAGGSRSEAVGTAGQAVDSTPLRPPWAGPKRQQGRKEPGGSRAAATSSHLVETQVEYASL